MREVAESLERDKLLLSLPRLSRASKLRLLTLKYGFRAARGVGLNPPSRFRLNGRTYYGDSYADPGFLVLNLVEMHQALSALGLQGKPDLKLVDVGAHHGETALAWTMLLDRPRVLSFEPNPICFRRALLNTRGLPIRVINVGLGESHGTLPFDDSDPVSMRRTFAFADTAKAQGGPVAEVRRGDGLIDFPVVDLLKIDVEGYEYPVLRGLQETLKRCRSLMIELSLDRPHAHTFSELASFLADYPFELVSAGTLWREGKRFSCIDLVFKTPALDAPLQAT